MLSEINATTPTNAIDPHLMTSLAVIGMFILQLLVNIRSLARKPSVDVDLSGVRQSLAHMEEDLEKISKRLSAGDTIMGHLQVNQAVNSESIKNMSVSIHELSSQMQVVLAKLVGRRAS
jgi:hypothetical protein